MHFLYRADRLQLRGTHILRLVSIKILLATYELLTTQVHRLLQVSKHREACLEYQGAGRRNVITSKIREEKQIPVD